jgi:hypothetical protein
LLTKGNHTITEITLCWCCWLLLCTHLVRPQLGVVGNNVKGRQCGQCAAQGVAWQEEAAAASTKVLSLMHNISIGILHIPNCNQHHTGTGVTS